ncbi:MAG: hypothetical protein QW620_03015 [Thermoplasmata archaeon]
MLLRRWSILVIIFVVIFCCVSFSFFIFIIPWSKNFPFDTTHYVNGLATRLTLKPSEVESLDFNRVKTQLEKIDFGIENHSNPNPSGKYYREYMIYSPLNRTPIILLSVYVILDISNSTPDAYMDVDYWGVYPESEIEARKSYVVSEVNQISQICNLTVSWSDATWSVWYQD